MTSASGFATSWLPTVHGTTYWSDRLATIAATWTLGAGTFDDRQDGSDATIARTR